jgi:myo-inositol-hexaphosphate 3-phosphohydrolase
VGPNSEPASATPEEAAVASFSVAADATVLAVNKRDGYVMVHLSVGPGYDYHVQVFSTRAGWVEGASHN